jgi:pimeloyl-ACP methyl ester carboxylesterase
MAGRAPRIPPGGLTALIRHSVGFGPGPHPAYYELLEPAEPRDAPLMMMVHGGAHTGSCYQVTADRRPGWAHRFAERGYRVAVPDWPGHGRSGYVHPNDLGGEVVCTALADLIADLGEPVVLLTHSRSGAFGWTIAERVRDLMAGLVGVAPSPPGNTLEPAEILSETDSEIVARAGFWTRTITIGQAAPPPREFVQVKLIGDGPQFPVERADDYEAALTTSGWRLTYERQNVRGSQVRVKDPGCLAGLPVLVVTGDHDHDHPREHDAAIVSWLVQQGARASHLWLADVGITGNGHMLMLERNSDRVADAIMDWLSAWPGHEATT